MLKQLIGNRTPVSADAPLLRRVRAVGALVFLLVAMIGTLYINSAWQRYSTHEMENRLSIGTTVANMIMADCVLNLESLPSDTGTGAGLPSVSALPAADTNFAPTEPGARIRASLLQVAKENESIANISLIALKGNQVYTLIRTDENGPTEISETVRQSTVQVYQTQKSVTIDLLSSGNSLWLNTLSPIRQSSTNRVLGVLSITFYQKQWLQNMIGHMLPDLIVTICLLILCAALYGAVYSQTSLQMLSTCIASDEALFHGVFEQAPIGISIGHNDQVTYAAPDGRYSINRRYSEILGRNPDELGALDWRTITHPDDLAADLALQDQYQRGDIPGYSLEKRFLKPDGTYVWTNMMIARLKESSNTDDLHICLLEDISARKRAEEALAESERSKTVLLSHLPGLAYRCKYDRDWTMLFVSEGCENLTGYKPESLIHNRDITYNDLIAPEYRELLWSEWARVLNHHAHFRHEYELITRDGTRKWVMELGQFILDDHDEILALEGIVIDITESKVREAQVTYLNDHDFLTGLFNRSYFTKQKQVLSHSDWMPVSVAICDINGVRLINDAFGLTEGDHMIADVAHMLQQVCRQGDVLCRTGGDEFTLLMPRTSQAEAAFVADEMLRSVENHNHVHRAQRLEISVSVGICTAEKDVCTLEQALINAEEHLNHRKLINQKSSHNAIVSSIMAALYARSQETEEHGQRLTQWTRMLGEAMGLSQSMLDDLMLFSMLHDIGKVGIHDRILNKPGPLTAEEWQIMKTHSEIGQRIASSTPELEHIADWILTHHEKWNGQGYPRGLAKEEIPLPARILSIADAYDAMTQDRIYRPAMSAQDALAEMERCAGTQFDPEIAQLFVRLMREHM